MTSPNQTKNTKLLWMIIAGISIIVVLFFAIQWFLAQKNLQTTTNLDQPIAEKIISQEAEEANTATPEITTIDESEVPTPIQLVQESLIKQPLPTNDSLAKEEIAKLDDIHHQLKDQQKDLKQQHEDVDALLRLKEEQIKLLEAQIQQAQSS